MVLTLEPPLSTLRKDGEHKAPALEPAIFLGHVGESTHDDLLQAGPPPYGLVSRLAIFVAQRKSQLPSSWEIHLS